MLGGLALCRNIKQIRTVAVIGSSMLVALAAYLVFEYLGLRAAGDTSEMLFTGSWMWYAPLNIHLALGVDGISVMMLVLSSIIVFSGVFASWNMDPMPKEFFLWLILLSL